MNDGRLGKNNKQTYPKINALKTILKILEWGKTGEHLI